MSDKGNRDIDAGKGFSQPQDEAAQCCAWNTADPTHNRGGESFQSGQKSHGVTDAKEDDADQHPCTASQDRTDKEGSHNHLIDHAAQNDEPMSRCRRSKVTKLTHLPVAQ